MVPPFPGDDVDGSGAPSGLDMSDLDAFIASVTVPPPPKDSPDRHDLPPSPFGQQQQKQPEVSTTNRKSRQKGEGVVLSVKGSARNISAPASASPAVSESADDDVFFPPPPEVIPEATVPKTPSWERLVGLRGSQASLEEEFAMLVTPPPPPGTLTPLLGEISIVPPVDVKTPSPMSENGGSPPRGVDTSLLPGGVLPPPPGTDTNDMTSLPPPLNESVIQVKAEIEKEMQTVDMTDPALAFERLSIKERIASLESPKLQRAAANKPPAGPSASSSRHSSIELTPPSSQSPSLDVSGSGPSPGPGSGVHPKRPFLWRPAEVRSADSSPVHRGKDFPPSPSPLSSRTESTGTLNRNKRVPPPPPPRRSSMPATELTNQSPSPPAVHPPAQRSVSVEPSSSPSPRAMPLNLFAEIKSRTQGLGGGSGGAAGKNRNYVNVTVSHHLHSASETAINKLAYGGGEELASAESGIPSSLAPCGMSVSACPTPSASSPVASTTSIPKKFDKIPAAKTASLDNAELEKIKRYRVPDTRRNPRSASALDLRRGSYEHPQKDYYTKASSSKNKRASKEEDLDLDLESGSNNSKFKGRRSPSFTRKLLAFEFKKEKAKEKEKDKMWAHSSDASSDAGESDTTGSTGSPKSLSRAHALANSNNTGSGSSPSSSTRSGASPRGSPIIHRHASLSKMADRALSPLRNLFGGSSSADRDRASSTESEAGSGPPSPHVMRSSNLPRSTMRPFGSSAANQVLCSFLPLCILSKCYLIENQNPLLK